MKNRLQRRYHPPEVLLWDYKDLPSQPEARVRRLLLTFPYSFYLFRPEDIAFVEAHKDRLFKDHRLRDLWDHMKDLLFSDLA